MSRSLISWLVITLGLALTPALAAAQTGQAETPPGSPASFFALDRQDEVSRVGTRFSYGLLDVDEDVTIWSTELYAQYAHRLDPSGAVGPYAHFVISHIGADNGVDSTSETAISNVELGGFYAARSQPSLLWVARAGVTLPTADDSFDAAISNLVNGVARLTDMINGVPKTTWARVSGSLITTATRDVRFRLDLGVDVPVSSADDYDPDTMMHLNAAVGVPFGPVTATLELANMANLTGDADFEDRLAHTATVGADFNAGQIHPRLALVFPLDDSSLADTITMFLVAGAEGAF